MLIYCASIKQRERTVFRQIILCRPCIKESGQRLSACLHTIPTCCQIHVSPEKSVAKLCQKTDMPKIFYAFFTINIHFLCFIIVMVHQATLEMVITDGMSVGERVVKRVFDIVGAVFGLVLLSPVFVVIFVVLKYQGFGSVIFRQERIGYHGRPFYILKFRTMVLDSEEDGVPMLAQKSDERLTPVGRFLREHHLDELPQLWNVLRGDMSFVGPRPERKYFIDKIMQCNPDYEYIYLMRPGTTSLATIYNGYTDTMEKMLIRLQMDLDYLQKRSLLLDLKIMLTTAEYIIFGKKF